MFRWLPIVWANLKRRKLRLVFTFISILLAFLMFGMLDAMRTSLRGRGERGGRGSDADAEQDQHDRCRCRARHYEKIQRRHGVRKRRRHSTGSAASTRTPSARCRCRPRIPSSCWRCIRRSSCRPEEIAAWKRDRQGMIIGQLLADQYGWKVGDRVPVRSQIWRKLDGARHLGVQHRRHLRRRRRWRQQGQRVFPVRLFQRVAAVRQGPGRHDRHPRGRQRRDRSRRRRASTSSSKIRPTKPRPPPSEQFVKRLLDQVGNIGAILVSVTAAVFFTMLLVTANTMAQSVRERTNEIGVLKTLGFSGQAILTQVLLESLLLTFSGGLVGTRTRVVAGERPGRGRQGLLPFIPHRCRHIYRRHFADAGVRPRDRPWPALTAMRLKIVDALRRI